MNCPECGAVGAYVGLIMVECPSATCRHYCAEHARRSRAMPPLEYEHQHWTHMRRAHVKGTIKV